MICTDHSISKEDFALSICNKCGLIFTNPRPSPEALPRYYQSDNYISHTSKATNLVNLLYKFVRFYTTKKKIQLIRKYTSTCSLLDYGCGTGYFLQFAVRKGYTASGYEPNQDARSIVAGKGLNSFDSLSDIKSKVGIISAWHVLEHVSDLRKTLKKLCKLLEKDGFMFIAVPNINSFDAKHYGTHWAGLDVPRHLYHFTQNSIGTLFEKQKLKLVATEPMYFDSYYVSLLSEKYLSGRSNFVKALRTGYKSNKLASKTKEYSSMIYIVQKQ
ncbi:MAG: class I SAM-dependent methyltransferase [Bacteroidota bacterium]